MGYLYRALQPRRRGDLIDTAEVFLRELRGQFDALVFRGMSGALVAPELATRLQCGLFFVRKGESCHGSAVEGSTTTPGMRVVYVDDFIASGDTIRACREGIKKLFYDPTLLVEVAIFLWNDYDNMGTYEGLPVWRIPALGLMDKLEDAFPIEV